MTHCKLISANELCDRKLEGAKKGDEHVYLEPGMMWYLPEVWDHQDPDLEQYARKLSRLADKGHKCPVSSHYLRDWSKVRDPLCIMLPNAILFQPDSNPSGTLGWKVLGLAPTITLDKPLIVQRSYSFQIMDGEIRPKTRV